MDPGYQPAAPPPFTENGGPEKRSDLIKVKQLLLAAQENLEMFRGTGSVFFLTFKCKITIPSPVRGEVKNPFRNVEKL